MEQDKLAKTPVTNMQFALIVGGCLGLGHFAFGIYLTLRIVFVVDDQLSYFCLYVLPYIGIAGFFAATMVFGLRGRLRLSGVLLVIGLVVSVAVFVYDFKNCRYQFSGTGHGPTFTIWWWYYEPYWYGYRPGNV